MQETNIYGYYIFGYNYYWLRVNIAGCQVHKGYDALVPTIDSFLQNLRLLNLQVTEMAAEELRKIRSEASKLPEDATVDNELARRISEACDKLDATLDAELQLRSAFVVTPKRFQLDHLLKSPGNLFAEGIFGQLSPLCQFDFTEACRCIAFGLPTAAAFHNMRGVEGALRAYYCAIVKRNRVKRLLWHDMITHLRQRREVPPKALLDNLDNIRANFRNPTQHPDARYDMDEAQDLLAVSIDAVNRMARDTKKRPA